MGPLNCMAHVQKLKVCILFSEKYFDKQVKFRGSVENFKYPADITQSA